MVNMKNETNQSTYKSIIHLFIAFIELYSQIEKREKNPSWGENGAKKSLSASSPTSFFCYNMASRSCCIFREDSSRIESVTWPYLSNVKATVACPRFVLIVLISSPA